MRSIEEVEALECEFLTCMQVAEILGASQQMIHKQAIECPERLGFHVIVIGSRVKIPRRAFIQFMKGNNIMEVRDGIK